MCVQPDDRCDPLGLAIGLREQGADGFNRLPILPVEVAVMKVEHEAHEIVEAEGSSHARVPQRFRIGEEGQGFTYQMLQFQEERLWAAASCIESLTRNLEDTIAYARERRIFGQSVLDHQVVHYRLAELKTEIEALRALTWRAADLHLEGKDVTDLASMAKLKAGRLLREVPDTCLQYWGGMGYTWDNPLARAYRDGRLASIGAGADEVMLGIICKSMGILPGGGHTARGSDRCKALISMT
jgi:alkylation response protein AidB-like acyl-CoA dehydrogenase